MCKECITTNAASINGVNTSREGDGYYELLAGIRKTFGRYLAYTEGDGRDHPLFHVDYGEKVDLYDVFLQNIPAEARQHYTCSNCRHFVNRFGDLVSVDTNTGMAVSAIWPDEVPDFFAPAVEAVRRVIRRSKISRVFISSEITLGNPHTGPWSHMSVGVPTTWKYYVRTGRRPGDTTISDTINEYGSNYDMLRKAVQIYSMDTITTAISYLRSGNFFRPEKFLPQVEWLKEMVDMRDKLPEENRRNDNCYDNLLWYAAVTTPTGWTHIANSAVGTLLDNIKDGFSEGYVRDSFNRVVDPINYQRPKAAPTAGQVRNAEEIVAKLNLTESLKRRYARLDELKLIWSPVKAVKDTLPKSGGGVFSNVVTKEKESTTDKKPTITAEGAMTWEKFNRTVLPTAEKIEFYVPYGDMPFTAYVTAAVEDAPPILSYDKPDDRNPVSTYTYYKGSPANQWGLAAHTWVNVTGISTFPNQWTDTKTGLMTGIVLILEGARDMNHDNIGIGLFPEILRSELHHVRSVIESYSRDSRFSGYEESTACGIALPIRGIFNFKVRVTDDHGIATVYTIDRMD